LNRLFRNGLLLFLAYGALAVLGLQWARVGGAGSAVWPAFGISLAGLLLGGWRLWPAIFAGRLVAGLLAGSEQPLWAEVAIAGANAAADLLAALFLQRVRFDTRLHSLRDILLLSFGVAGSAAVSATLGTLILSSSSNLGLEAAGDLWSGWWFGNLVAGLTLTPLILSWARPGALRLSTRGAVHLALCLATTAALAFLVFHPEYLPSLRIWHLFPALIWAALAFDVRGASAALLISSAYALWGVELDGTVLGAGGLDPVTAAQQFVAVTSLTVLLLAAVADERRRVEPIARLAAIAGSSPDAMIGLDRRGLISSWNAGARRLFGYEAEEAVGHGLDMLSDPNGEGPAPSEIFARIMAGEKLDLETVRAGKTGEPLDVHVSGSQLLAPTGEVIGALLVLRDIRSRRRAEAALREESQTLELLNRTGAALAAELDLDRIVQMVTDAGREVSGAQFGAFFYNAYNAEGESYMLYTLSGAERSQFEGFGLPRATSVFQPTFKGEGIIRSDDILADPRYGKNEPHFGMPKGHLPVRSYLAVPVFSRDGSVIGGLFFGHAEPAIFTERAERIMAGLAAQAAIAIDNSRLFKAAQEEIAERRRAEAALRELNDTLEQRVVERTTELMQAQDQLRQAQKMEAIGQLTGGVAHDFNNLLTIIRSSVDLLRRGALPEEKRSRYLEAISDTADRAAKLTAQLLAFARRQALKPETFEAGERVRLVADMVRTVVGSRISLNLDIDCDQCFIEADIAQFETAIINMAVNARDAMDAQGTLTISARPALQEGQDTWRRDPEGDHVCISVSDTGRGIPPELLAQIFEPFFTTKEVGKGTGLGLSQVYGFVKQSGGDVQVESEVGRGTTFSLYLPKVAAPAVPEREHAARPDGPVQRTRLLVVEDNPEVGDFATQLLSELGHETMLARSGAEALELLERHAGEFDLVFTDVVMPGISGIELGHEIRKRHPGMRVVLTSGYSHILAHEGRHGFELLHKPYSVESLTSVLRHSEDEAPA
jgi:PAS domain S-box-containing protein